MIETIYVALLGAAPAWRPVQAERRADGGYRILSQNDDPEDERWEFSSGSVVCCEPRRLADGDCLVATGLMSPRLLKLVRPAD